MYTTNVLRYKFITMISTYIVYGYFLFFVIPARRKNKTDFVGFLVVVIFYI